MIYLSRYCYCIILLLLGLLAYILRLCYDLDCGDDESSVHKWTEGQSTEV